MRDQNNEEAMLVTKRQEATLLAVSTRTIDRIADRGHLKRIHINKSVRFKKSDLFKLIEAGC